MIINPCCRVLFHASCQNGCKSFPSLVSHLRSQDRSNIFTLHFTGSASLKAHTCQPRPPQFNVTLQAGSAAGIFWKLGRVKDVDHCGQLCCRQQKCSLALSVDEFCYNVECHSEKMCLLKGENVSRHNVAVTLVTRSVSSTFDETVMRGKYQSKDKINSNSDKMKSKDYSLDTKTNTDHRTLPEAAETLATYNAGHRSFTNISDAERGGKYQSVSLSSYESRDRGTGFELNDSFPTKAVVRFESKLSHDRNSEPTKSGRCRARRVLRKVTLRSGLKSGDFSDYGQVPDINACVKHCCEQQTCDVSLLLNKHCYTLHCYKPELCKIMPSHDSKLEPQLAFVTRSANDDESNTRVKKKASSSNGGTCPHGAIFSDVSLKGGHKAGKFELLTGAKDMRSCIQKCCASPSCQVAWLLGDHCYSVACYES